MLQSLRSLPGEVSGVKVSRSAPLRQPRRSAVCSMGPQKCARGSVDVKTLAPAHEEKTSTMLYYAPDALGSHRAGLEKGVKERSFSSCLQLGTSNCGQSAHVMKAGDCVQVVFAATIRAVAYVSLQSARAFGVDVGFVLCALTRNAGQMGPYLGAAHKWMEHWHRSLCFGRTCKESKWARRSDKRLVHCAVSRCLCVSMMNKT
jgi:hypothetical protein